MKKNNKFFVIFVIFVIFVSFVVASCLRYSATTEIAEAKLAA